MGARIEAQIRDHQAVRIGRDVQGTGTSSHLHVGLDTASAALKSRVDLEDDVVNTRVNRLLREPGGQEGICTEHGVRIDGWTDGATVTRNRRTGGRTLARGGCCGQQALRLRSGTSYLESCAEALASDGGLDSVGACRKQPGVGADRVGRLEAHDVDAVGKELVLAVVNHLEPGDVHSGVGNLAGLDNDRDLRRLGGKCEPRAVRPALLVDIGRRDDVDDRAVHLCERRRGLRGGRWRHGGRRLRSGRCGHGRRRRRGSRRVRFLCPAVARHHDQQETSVPAPPRSITVG